MKDHPAETRPVQQSSAMATMQKYRDYVITSFTKAVQPIVVEKARGAVIMDAMDKEYLDALPESPFVGHSSRGNKICRIN